MEPTARENAALVEEFLTGVITDGDTDALGIFLTDEAVDCHVMGGRPGIEPTTLWCWGVLAAADVDITIDTVVAGDEMVAVRGTVTGTHRESLVDLAPTGRTFEIAVAWFCRIEDGRIAELWSLPDGLGLVQQLDAIPQVAQNSP